MEHNLPYYGPQHISTLVQSILSEIIRRPSTEHVVESHNKEIPEHPKRSPGNVQFAPSDFLPLHRNLQHRYIEHLGDHEQLHIEDPRGEMKRREDLASGRPVEQLRKAKSSHALEKSTIEQTLKPHCVSPMYPTPITRRVV